MASYIRANFFISVDCFPTQKNYNVHHEKVGTVNMMAHSGTGLWVSLKNSATICLYHTETFKHLQDINIASNVNRVLVGKFEFFYCFVDGATGH